MPPSKLTQNILSQADSLADVLRHHREHRASLAQAATLLQSNKRVILTGMGASLFASLPLEYFLRAQGIDATAIEAGELLHYPIAGLHGALVMIVSRSGESIEIARLLQSLKDRTSIIGVCNEPASTLARSAGVSILVGSREDDYVAVQTYTGTLLTLFLLAGAVRDDLNTADQTATALLSEFGALVQDHVDRRDRWDSFLPAHSPPYLLARGPSGATASAGALLFNEVAKSPVVAMAAGSFRHGPVEVVDEDFRAFVFAPRGSTRDLNVALTDDLTRFGGRVQLIGPDLAETSNGCEIPDAPEYLAPLFEIVPLQAAALRLAETKGIAPGTFRFAPRVAVDEASFTLGEQR